MSLRFPWPWCRKSSTADRRCRPNRRAPLGAARGRQQYSNLRLEPLEERLALSSSPLVGSPVLLNADFPTPNGGGTAYILEGMVGDPGGGFDLTVEVNQVGVIHDQFLNGDYVSGYE
jgi:hypothetical protein